MFIFFPHLQTLIRPCLSYKSRLTDKFLNNNNTKRVNAFSGRKLLTHGLFYIKNVTLHYVYLILIYMLT